LGSGNGAIDGEGVSGIFSGIFFHCWHCTAADFGMSLHSFDHCFDIVLKYGDTKPHAIY